MDNYQLGGGHFTPQAPQFVQDVRQGSSSEPLSETIDIAASANVKDAIGSTVIADITQGPILEQYGGRIGSFWGSARNLQYSQKVQAVVETNGSATFAISDTNTDLEKIFEGVDLARYIARLTDGAGKIIYGWIGLVAVSSDVYTFDIWNGVALGTQNWFQGGSTAFDHSANGSTVEIYRYSTSLTFGSSDTFTEELPFRPPADPTKLGESEFRFLKSLTDGQYGIDYQNSRFLGRKANADDSEVFTYRSFSGPGGTADAVNIAQLGGVSLVKEGATWTTNTNYPMPLGLEIDDPTNLATETEGTINIAKGDFQARQIMMNGMLAAGEDLVDDVLGTTNKLLATNTYAFSKDVSAALEASSISKASAGNLHGAFGVIDASAATDTYYIQFLDSATLPGNGAVTHIVTPIPVSHTNGTDSTFDLGEVFLKNPAAAENGIVIVQSTTLVTKTIATGGDIAMFATVAYK